MGFITMKSQQFRSICYHMFQAPGIKQIQGKVRIKSLPKVIHGWPRCSFLSVWQKIYPPFRCRKNGWFFRPSICWCFKWSKTSLKAKPCFLPTNCSPLLSWILGGFERDVTQQWKSEVCPPLAIVKPSFAQTLRATTWKYLKVYFMYQFFVPT